MRIYYMAHERENKREQEHQYQHEHVLESQQESRVEKPTLSLFNVVESVVLAMSVGLMLWVANLVVEHGRILSSHETLLKVDDTRIDALENRGSSPLNSHVMQSNSEMSALRARVDKVESAVVALQATPGELRAIGVRLDGIKEAQSRMEKSLDDVTSGRSSPR